MEAGKGDATYQATSTKKGGGRLYRPTPLFNPALPKQADDDHHDGYHHARRKRNHDCHDSSFHKFAGAGGLWFSTALRGLRSTPLNTYFLALFTLLVPEKRLFPKIYFWGHALLTNGCRLTLFLLTKEQSTKVITTFPGPQEGVINVYLLQTENDSCHEEGFGGCFTTVATCIFRYVADIK